MKSSASPKLRVLDDRGKVAQTSLPLAVLCEERLDDPERAARAYRQVLAVSDTHRGARRGLEHVHGRLGERG